MLKRTKKIDVCENANCAKIEGGKMILILKMFIYDQTATYSKGQGPYSLHAGVVKKFLRRTSEYRVTRQLTRLIHQLENILSYWISVNYDKFLLLYVFDLEMKN